MATTNRATLLHSGVVYGSPEADAVLCEGDRIVAVGRTERLHNGRGEGAWTVDLHGRIVLPGFIDAHIHLLHTGLVACGWRVDLSGRSREDAVAALAATAAERGDGAWVIGGGWDESVWDDRRYLTRQELDRISSRSPIAAIRMDGHLLTANSAALAVLPPTAPERLIDRRDGLVREAAADALLALVVPDRATRREAFSAAADVCHRLGVTSVHTMSRLRDVAVLMEQRGERRLRVTTCPEAAALDRLAAVGLRSGYGDAWLRFGGLKLFADGSIGAANAAVYEPYADGGRGELNHSEEDVRSWIRAAETAGWQTIIHAIGGRAIELVISAHEALGTSRAYRHRIEHFELPGPTHPARAEAAGLAVCMQPNFIGNWSGPSGMYVDRLGAERDRASNPLRGIVAAGVRLGFGSDGMPVSPLYGLHWAVNGPYPDQRLAVGEAIDAYTRGGAWLGFEEHDKATITPGALADLVVLDRDPRETAETIKERRVEMTFVGGQRVYSGEAAA